MTKVGIICEYNPFHNGHAAQIRRIREEIGPDCAVVCLMSGNYVQRGAPAIFHRSVRAEAAILGGADLVLELPLTCALSSAEGFADGGVRILTALGCDVMSFGSECGDHNILMSTAKWNLDDRFDSIVRQHLASGCSYPTARASALRELADQKGNGAASEENTADGSPDAPDASAVLSHPNDILAVEYCKALLRQQSPMQIHVIRRPGSYHARDLDPEAPSATALRDALKASRCGDADKHGLSPRDGAGAASEWRAAVPAGIRDLYAAAPLHTMAAGERACLAVLSTCSDDSFRALPYGSEGLWSKLMKNCRSCIGLEEIVNATKSKRYTHSRIRRMLLCAVLGLTGADLCRTPPYVRVLAFNDRGRAVLREWKTNPEAAELQLINAGQTPPDPAYYALESRAAALYSLFTDGPISRTDAEIRQRVIYKHAEAYGQCIRFRPKEGDSHGE